MLDKEFLMEILLLGSLLELVQQDLVTRDMIDRTLSSSVDAEARRLLGYVRQ